MLTRLRREEDGQLLLLVLAYAVIAGLLVTVVVDVSQAYLGRVSAGRGRRGGTVGGQPTQLAERFDDFQVADDTDGASVTITSRAVVHLPFVNLVSSRWRGGYPVQASATARTRLTP